MCFRVNSEADPTGWPAPYGEVPIQPILPGQPVDIVRRLFSQPKEDFKSAGIDYLDAMTVGSVQPSAETSWSFRQLGGGGP